MSANKIDLSAEIEIQELKNRIIELERLIQIRDAKLERSKNLCLRIFALAERATKSK